MLNVDQIKLDFQRPDRLGFDEAIFCAQKSAVQINEILKQADEEGVSFLLSRLRPDIYAGVLEEFRAKIDYDPLSLTAYFNFKKHNKLTEQVVIVTAGTTDVPVAREAARTLNYYGIGTKEINDVGVAGIWRLMERVDDIKKFPVTIAVAGMDAALISVLGGLIGKLIIAVPTSTGYGAAEAGKAALASALVSCAPGMVVCNIDNGYGAACAAIRAINAFK